MAARLNPQHDASTREKIRTSQLVNRLNSYALGETDPQSGKPVELSSGQLKAIEVLLRKVLPDLQATQINASVSLHEDKLKELE